MAQRALERACVELVARRASARPASAASRSPAAWRRTSRSTGASGCCRASTTSTCFRTWATAAWRRRRALLARSRVAVRRCTSTRRPRHSAPSTTTTPSRRRCARADCAYQRVRGSRRRASPTCSRTNAIVLWFQGRMEYGPRALGHRSVLARPDRPALRDRLNLVLKRRVWYQPFCPSMLESDARAALLGFHRHRRTGT